MVDLLSYVHAKTHSLETQDLCDRAWKHYKEVIAERGKLKQIAERVNSWETELLLANNALKEKNSQLETERDSLKRTLGTIRNVYNEWMDGFMKSLRAKYGLHSVDWFFNNLDQLEPTEVAQLKMAVVVYSCTTTGGDDEEDPDRRSRQTHKNKYAYHT